MIGCLRTRESSSQIDCVLISASPGCPLKAEIFIADMHYLNTSDHTHLELSLTMTLLTPCKVTSKTAESGVSKIWLGKV